MEKCSKERLDEKINNFNDYGKTENGSITRLSLSKEELDARYEFCRICRSLNMIIKTDDMANIYATLPGDTSLKAILMGSHLDSVTNGGKYDGVLGVLCALEVAETIVKNKIKHKHSITIVSWTNGKGIRFKPEMMASGVISGKYNIDKFLNQKDCDDISLQEALEASGYKGRYENRVNKDKYNSFLELNIEHSKELESENCDIWIADGNFGNVNYEFKIILNKNNEINYDTTKVILEEYNTIKEYFSKKQNNRVICKISKIDLCDKNNNKQIEGKFDVDISYMESKDLKCIIRLIKKIQKSSMKFKIYFKENKNIKNIKYNKGLNNLIEKNLKESGYSYKKTVSTSIHDAQFIADIIPTTMILIPSKGNHSNYKNEFISLENCYKGTNVLLQTILSIDKINN